MAAFYLDEDVALRLARLLTDRGHVVATTERRKGAPDARQLLHAAERGWVLLTNNADHFRLLHDGWLTWSHAWRVAQPHSGILVLPQVIAAELPLVAIAVDELVRARGNDLQVALWERAPTTGWQAWPR